MSDITIIIPTYGKKIEEDNTLPHLLKSIQKLKERNFRVIVLNDTVDIEYHKKIKIKIDKIINPFKKYLKINQLDHKDLNKLHQYFNSNNLQYLSEQINFNNYSGFRNIGLIVANILNTSIVIFLDDDEIIEDKNYLKKAQEFIGKKYKGKFIGGITGYYINSNGSYLLPKKSLRERGRNILWDKDKYLNKAFEIVSNKKRLNETPFALGGNIVIHKNMFKVVPFDTYIKRGEDIDLLINARYLGYAFLLDNQLGVRHIPSEEASCLWLKKRLDAYRFIYERKKLFELIKDRKLEQDIIESLDPYPGHFLRWHIYLKLIVTSFLVGFTKLIRLKFKDSIEHFRNIKISLIDVNKYANKNCRGYFQLQQIWPKMMSDIAKDRDLVKYFKDKFK